ncbi:MAG: outer membrane beta-barrel protein [Bacteroidales bacterium]|nr:outer membrane beta-barrel protein [Bacteroidales bacterium]
MKKYLLSLVAILAMAFGASAQRAQFQIGYGGYTMMDACDMHDGGAVNTAWGAVTAGVNFKVARNFTLGGTYTFSSSSYKHSDNANIYYHVVMLNGRYDYYRNSIVTLYGHLGIGVDFSHMTWHDNSKNKAYFAMQASPLGAEVGLSRVTSIFGELGFGAQGLLQVGFRFNL